MATPLDYERFGLSQDRYARQGDQFGETMDFRRQQDERNFGYRTERDASMMDYRDEQAARQERLAMMRMLPKFQRMQQAGQYFGGGAMSGPARAQSEYDAALDRQDAHNFAAVPSWQAERERSDFATDTGMDLRNYAAQQQAQQRMRLQARQTEVERPINEALAAQQAADMEAERLKQGFTDASQIGKFYGAAPGDLYNNYDPKTGTSNLPGDHVADGMGGFKQKPGRQVKLDPRQYAALRAYASPQEAGGAPGTPDPKQALAQRITQIAGERRIMPQAIESARAKLRAKGVFTEKDIVDALEAEDAQWFKRNLSQGQAFVDQIEHDRQAHFLEESKRSWGRQNPIFQGLTPMAFP